MVRVIIRVRVMIRVRDIPMVRCYAYGSGDASGLKLHVRQDVGSPGIVIIGPSLSSYTLQMGSF